jgi:hypothetical protein
LHGMLYYIFLKSLRSLEEFRKIPRSKSLLIFRVQISKALVNSKIQFLIRKSFYFTFGPATHTGPLGLWPSQPYWPLFSRRPKPIGRPKPLGPRAPLAYLQKYAFSFDSRLSFSVPPLYPPLTQGAHLSGRLLHRAGRPYLRCR